MKLIFQANFTKNEKNGTVANFWPSLWTIPFGKIPVFRLLFTFFFYSLERRIFYSRISWNTLCCPILPKIKNMENFQFLIKTMDQTFWTNSCFSIFFKLFYFSLTLTLETYSAVQFCLTKKDWKITNFLTSLW